MSEEVRNAKPLIGVGDDTTLEDLVRAAYYSDSFIVAVISPRGLYGLTVATMETFQVEDLSEPARRIWFKQWEALRQAEQATERQHTAPRHPDGHEFDPQEAQWPTST